MKCKDCGSEMIDMIYSAFCKNDCDRKPAKRPDSLVRADNEFISKMTSAWDKMVADVYRTAAQSYSMASVLDLLSRKSILELCGLDDALPPRECGHEDVCWKGQR